MTSVAKTPTMTRPRKCNGMPTTELLTYEPGPRAARAWGGVTLRPHFETEQAFSRLVRYDGVVNAAPHPVGDSAEQLVGLLWCPFYDEFDGSVRQIPHVPGDAQARGQPLGRVAEAHALHLTLVDYVAAHGHASAPAAGGRGRYRGGVPQCSFSRSVW